MSDFKWQVRDGCKVIAQFVFGTDAEIFIDALDGIDKETRIKEPNDEQQAEKD